MHSVRIRIEGNYWESFIYSGKLYLWEMNGTIITIDWENMIYDLKNKFGGNKFIDFAFVNGNDLYLSRDNPLLADPEVNMTFLRRLAEIDGKEFQISRQELQSFVIWETPFKHLPNSIDIYNNKIYSATDDGLWETSIMRKSRGKVSSRPVLIQSESVYDLRINRNKILLSCGDSGLLRHDLPTKESYFSVPENSSGQSIDGFKEVNERTYQLTSNHSMSANWCYSSVINQGSSSDFEFLGFTWQSNHPNVHFANEKFHLVFQGKYQIDTFVKDRESVQFCFGFRDKMYFIRKNEIDIFQFTQKNLGSDKDPPFQLIRAEKTMVSESEIFSAEATFFGIIIETATGVLWHRSNNEVVVLGSKISNLKAFPRSKNYENQIHVIFEDSMIVQADLNDYFVDQKTKAFGAKYPSQRRHNGA